VLNSNIDKFATDVFYPFRSYVAALPCKTQNSLIEWSVHMKLCRRRHSPMKHYKVITSLVYSA